VTPTAADYPEKARTDLDESRKIEAIDIAAVAARSAYFAVFHAAEAFIFERTGKIAKTHAGVRAEFARLMKRSRMPPVSLNGSRRVCARPIDPRPRQRVSPVVAFRQDHDTPLQRI
jgi:hypothetical protein